MKKNTVVVFGGKGWIGSQLLPYLETRFDKVMTIDHTRADDEEAVEILLAELQPTHVISLIGRTHGEGCNNIDYLEKPGKLVENLRDNLYAPLVLALLCKEKGIHYTYIGTGCIFSRDNPASLSYGENDRPDFFGSSYSIVKGFTDRLFHHSSVCNNMLNIRIRMPISDDLHPRSFVTKLLGYTKVCSIANSMTVLPSLLPIIADLMTRRHTVTVNMVNPGIISHNEILQMYKDLVDPQFEWKNFTIDEQNEVLASKRSNNCLDTTLLTSLYPNVMDVHAAVRSCLVKIANR